MTAARPWRRYSGLALLRAGFERQRGWPPAFIDATPQSSYDVVIVGGGGHGLATAYYLARHHGVRRICVLEKGWIGGGNTGRNTTVIRSNYFFPESAALYDLSLRLYEGLSAELNYNIMFSQRGVWMLGHSRHDEEILRRSANAMLLNGVDAEFYNDAETHRRIRGLHPNPSFPIRCGLLQPRGGVARHDAVAWAYARAASRLGVDIIQNCEVLGFEISDGRVRSVRTSRGDIRAPVVGLAAAGHSSNVAGLAGLSLPLTSYALQAFVSEPVKPVLDTVLITSATGVYLSQSDKGELVIGGGLDLFPSYAQRGSLPNMERSAAGVLELFPQFSRLRFLRQWAGICDVSHDSSPILSATEVEGLYVNCGWGTGGFKAIPAGGWLFSHLLATGRSEARARAFTLERFLTGAMIDEAGAAAIAH
jgi:sarcosine oxidase subunit beta